jgi:CRISPR-associated protein Csb1
VSALEDLASEHLRRGGAATLCHPATYAIAEGAVVAPARYSAGRAGSTFVFETRHVDDAFRRTVLIDSKSSQSNRSEVGLLDARQDGGPATRIPVIEVRYPGRSVLDLQLPHRVFDAHIRASAHDGEPVVKQQWYRAVRDATAADLSPLFTTSPATLAFGGWDSTRKRGQLRLRGLYVSELFGVVADGEQAESKRSGARIDPLGQDFQIAPDEYEALLDGQRDEMSARTIRQVEAEIARARKRGTAPRASRLGLGGIPPGIETPFGVAVPAVRRARTFSLAGLRRLRFGGTADEDVAARTALLAMLLLGAAYADADPEIRAYCDVAAPRSTVQLDGEPIDLDLSIDACSALLGDAIEQLPERLAWSGQVMALDGADALDRGATAEGSDDPDADE